MQFAATFRLLTSTQTPVVKRTIVSLRLKYVITIKPTTLDFRGASIGYLHILGALGGIINPSYFGGHRVFVASAFIIALLVRFWPLTYTLWGNGGSIFVGAWQPIDTPLLDLWFVIWNSCSFTWSTLAIESYVYSGVYQQCINRSSMTCIVHSLCVRFTLKG